MPAIYIFSFQLVSPDDLVNACKMFEPLKLPLRYVHPSLALQPDSHFVATPTVGVLASFPGCLPLCFLEPPGEAVQRSHMWSRKWSGRRPSNEAKGYCTWFHPNLFWRTLLAVVSILARAFVSFPPPILWLIVFKSRSRVPVMFSYIGYKGVCIFELFWSRKGIHWFQPLLLFVVPSCNTCTNNSQSQR